MKRIDIDKIENIEQVKALLYMLIHATAPCSVMGLKAGEKVKFEIGDGYLERYPELTGLVDET